MQNNDKCVHICDMISDLVTSSDSFKITLNMDDSTSVEFILSDVVIQSPPPERDIAARNSDHNNRTYFTKKPICRMICTATDTSILDNATSKMLGPKADFSGVYVNIQTKTVLLRLLANITNSVLVQPESIVRLGLVIVDVIDTTTNKNVNLNKLYDLLKCDLS